ncbi:MAG: hypothetical protein E7662_06440 [Ruminococcaceae bacterium]|nr:hypothetical protein [Oscillospiraceae bacterium]
MKKRWVTVILPVILILLMSGCGNTPDTPDTTDTPRLMIIGEGAPEYVIVRPDGAKGAELDAVMLVRDALTEAGKKLKITTDWEKNPVSEYEIVIGDTLRAANDPAMPLTVRDVGEKGCFIRVSGSRIYICGGSPDATVQAAQHFVSTFCGSQTGSVSVPADYEHIVRQSYAISSVSVGGKDLREFRIVPEDTLEKAHGKAWAKAVQSFFYENTGIYMEIASAADADAPALILRGGSGGIFSVSADGGNLIFSAGISAAYERGWNRFVSDQLTGVSGEIVWDNGFRWETDLMAPVSYLEFGAVGDGVHDDMEAIIAAHAYANSFGLPVKADAGKTFLLAPHAAGAVIRTDTDFTGAKFIIDDREVPDSQRGSAVFRVEPSAQAYMLKDLKSLQKGQTDLGITLPADSVLILTESDIRRYIRKGVNANDGSEQQEIILADKNGGVDPATPILWDYPNLTSVQVIPREAETLTVRGGTFITVVQKDTPLFRYFSRGFKITRSNVRLEGMTHYVENEGEMGSAYYGFLNIADCADITVENCIFTTHRTFYYMKDNTRLSAGTYEITLTRAANVLLKNCSQTTDILDRKFSAALGSNNCKNLTVDGCRFANCDVGHTGAYNPVIRNSVIGHTPVSAIGFGTLLVENSEFHAHAIINLRSDFGSHWDGELIIRNCSWTPDDGRTMRAVQYSVITGSNTEDHDFGYDCMMPQHITVDNLQINDAGAPPSYAGITILADMNPAHTSASAEAAAKYPLLAPETVTVSGITAASGKPWSLSTNMYFFRNVQLIRTES